MIDMDIVPYLPQHAAEILTVISEGAVDGEQYAEQLTESTFAVTLMAPDGPVLSTGLGDLWPGVAEAWMVAHPEMIQIAPRSIARATKEVFEQKIAGYRRVQISVRDDWPTALRFARFLGFEDEGLMRMYGPDHRDYRRMSIVKGAN